MIRYTNNLIPPGTFKAAKRKPKKKKERVHNSGIILPRMVYENYSSVPSRQKPRTFIKRFAKENERNPTKSEKQFEAFLNDLNSGSIRGQFVCQHIFSSKWILDFFFPEIRLGIEIDGSIHEKPEQVKRDKQKNTDAKKFEITLLRITNAEVSGDRHLLIQKLRAGWRASLNGQRGLVEFPLGTEKSTYEFVPMAKRHLVLMICKKCGHTKKAVMPAPSKNKRYRCSICNALGVASVID